MTSCQVLGGLLTSADGFKDIDGCSDGSSLGADDIDGFRDGSLDGAADIDG